MEKKSLRQGLLSSRQRCLSCLLPLLTVVTLTPGCDRDSPSQPQTDVTPTLVFADDGALSSQRAQITSLLEDTFSQANRDISLEGLTIEIVAGGSQVIPNWGVGGSALGPDRVSIAVDPAISSSDLDGRLPGIAAHEFHHVARIRGVGYGSTLLESMVSEGLADHFSIELLGVAPPPWSQALTAEEYGIWYPRAVEEFDSTSFDFRAWFFGTGGEIPHWTGYTIGFRIVQEYKDANPGSSATSLVNTSGEVLRPD